MREERVRREKDERVRIVSERECESGEGETGERRVREYMRGGE